jgi:hypothetical protein
MPLIVNTRSSPQNKSSVSEVKWTEMHCLADWVLQELVKIEILRGSVEYMLKVHMGSVFMSHGLGYLLGISRCQYFLNHPG